MLAWKPSIFPVVSCGMGGLGPKFPEYIGRPGQRKTTGERRFGEKILTLFFPKVFGESPAEKSGLKTPPFSLWFPLAWVTWNLNSQILWGGCPSRAPKPPKLKETFGKIGGFQPRFSQSSLRGFWVKTRVETTFFSKGAWGELSGKIWIETPRPYSFLWPGWPGAEIHCLDPPPRPPKIWRPCPWEFSGSKSIGRRRPPKARKLKVTTRKKGGFTARIFPWAPPKEFWTTKCWLENPSIFPVVSFGVGGLHPSHPS